MLITSDLNDIKICSEDILHINILERFLNKYVLMLLLWVTVISL